MDPNDALKIDTESYFVGDAPVSEVKMPEVKAIIHTTPRRRAIPDQPNIPTGPGMLPIKGIWGNQPVKLLLYNEQYDYWLVELENSSWQIVYGNQIVLGA